MTTYQNIVLTLIALLLAAIVAKLYIPAAQMIGPQLSPPTRGEVLALRAIKDPKIREEKFNEIRQRAPAVWVNGGKITIEGTVEVDNTVDVSIVR